MFKFDSAEETGVMVGGLVNTSHVVPLCSRLVSVPTLNILGTFCGYETNNSNQVQIHDVQLDIEIDLQTRPYGTE